MISKHFDLIVIGSGSGGSVGAHHAASLGKHVAIVEREVLGGECPSFACVPTKALLHSAEVYETLQTASLYGIKPGEFTYDYKKVHDWKNFVVSRTGAAQGKKIFEESDITVLTGAAKFISPHEIKIGAKIYSADRYLIATGSEVAIPPIPGLEAFGYMTYKEAVDLRTVPHSLFILGGGAIGCEFTQIFSSFGVKIHLADGFDRLLAKEDEEVSALVQALFENRGVTVHTGIKVVGVTKRGDKKVVHFEKGTQDHSVIVDEILVATGKKPVIDLDLEKAHIAFDKHGIKVNNHLQTTNPRVYAAGDVVGPLLLTHTASYQSALAAHNMFSRKPIKPSYEVIPRCVFTDPEIASVGMTEAEAKEKYGRIRVGMAEIMALGRANTDNALDGFVKVICKLDGTIVGASIVASRAGEMIHELALAIKLRAKALDIASLVHAYPTYSEAVKVACASVE